MRVIVAEKPSLARSIAAAFEGQRQQFDGYIRVAGNTVITHCFGHMYELASPEKYNPSWAKWDLATLPIVIQPDQWMLSPKEDAKAQIRVIAGLLKNATSVVNAGDPDREGQMLVDELLEMLRWTGKTERLLLPDTTVTTVRKALASMKSNTEFANLYEAAKCRSQADWLVGMNLTRAASKRIGLTASIGRVQTPTLAMVVARDLQIEGHSASFFYTLAAQVSTARDSLVMVHDTDHDRITDKAEATRLAGALKGQTVSIAVSEKQVTEHAPLPFKLMTFQSAAEARYGWSSSKSLKALQEAYEKKLVSYPRTDCAHMPEELAKQAVPSVKRIIEAGHFQDMAKHLGIMAPSKRTYNDKKYAEQGGSHYGLCPVSLPPAAAKGTDEYKAWELVTEQFIKSLLPSYQALVKEASFVFEDRLFRAKGETPLNERESWRVMEPKRNRDGSPVAKLALSIGDGMSAQGRVGDVDVRQGKTTPPKAYTETSLIEDMAGVHKFVSDPRIKAMLKETAGIGTAATRSAIIETLKARQFVELVSGGRGKKYLRSTVLGRYLVKNMPPALCDPGITALWEEQLNSIASGTTRPLEFMQKIDRYVANNLTKIKAKQFPDAPKIEQKPVKKMASRPRARA